MRRDAQSAWALGVESGFWEPLLSRHAFQNQSVPMTMTNLIGLTTNCSFSCCYLNGPPCLAQTAVILLCLGLYLHPHRKMPATFSCLALNSKLLLLLGD